MKVKKKKLAEGNPRVGLGFDIGKTVGDNNYGNTRQTVHATFTRDVMHGETVDEAYDKIASKLVDILTKNFHRLGVVRRSLKDTEQKITRKVR